MNHASHGSNAEAGKYELDYHINIKSIHRYALILSERAVLTVDYAENYRTLWQLEVTHHQRADKLKICVTGPGALF